MTKRDQLRIEDYALIGDTQTAALVGNNGSIDWLCLPRFDSGACFAALLGDPRNGRWQIAPKQEVERVSRRYRPETLILETEFETETGAVRLIDFMPPRGQAPDVVRIVEGLRGHVDMAMQMIIRFDYGSVVPWVRQTERGLLAIAGPEALYLETPVETEGVDLTTVAEFSVKAGERVPFVLTWQRSFDEVTKPVNAEEALRQTQEFWHEWVGLCTYEGEWREEVIRSLLTLKALTYAPTGGIVAAATTSLPEWIGGVRNWDYRYCWLRDATFTLYAFTMTGFTEEAKSWRDWLLRAVAGDVSKLQIMYGAGGERRLTELELGWLDGYEGSRPVRIGNAASGQFQLDVYGEVIDAMHLARRAEIPCDEDSWKVEKQLMDFLETAWEEPDEGIWEVRGPRQHFTHSKVMAWVAADRAVKAVERFGLEGPVDKWRQLRGSIHDEVCERGFDADKNSFVQHFDSKQLDASLLMIPLVGFLPCTDPRVIGTVDAVKRELMRDGFVLRYLTAEADVDGLPPGEGAFLPCAFWLADNLALQGRYDEAREIFTRLLALQSDVGLLAEEYDVVNNRFLGNFPQAFTHVGLINTAANLSHATGPAHQRTKT